MTAKSATELCKPSNRIMVVAVVSVLVLATILLLNNTAARQESSFVLSEVITPGQKIRFEHSLDGTVWQDAFEVSMTLDDGVVDRSVYASALKNLLSSTAGAASNPSDSYYVLRSAEGNGAFGSIPLSCWAAAGADAEVEVAVGLDGGVRGVSPMAPCEGQALDGLGEMAVVDHVKLMRPRVVSISMEEGMGMVAGDVAERLVGGGLGSAEQGKKDVNDVNAKNDKSKKADDRTWLQKNWLFVALALFILANKLGGATG